ncbi:MAG: enoyl-CoA hydratase/isomerase family protein [Atopobiaceae bacterium]|nr:enoyl-CoA hydratase/isomerase family protein [Atopobiaceae bacterium]
MELQKVIYTVENGIATITMDYLKNLNAIDEQMADELIYVVEHIEDNPDVKVVILRGSGKAFSAGGDVGYFYDLVQAGGEINMDPLIAKVGIIASSIKQSKKMYITSVAGAAAGAGISLALAGDFMICADNAKFILAFVNLGLVPDTGAVYLLCKAIGTARTMDLAATGRVMDAQEAHDLGLAYQVTTAEELDATTLKLAEKLAAGPLVAYANIKKQVYAAAFSDYRQWLEEVEVPTQSECAKTEDFQEGVKAFMEKRKAQFQGK